MDILGLLVHFWWEGSMAYHTQAVTRSRDVPSVQLVCG